MPQFEYSYLAQPYTASSGRLIQEFRPFVPVILSKGKLAAFPIHALVDSGADYCLFPAQVAEIIGLNVKTGVKKSIYGIGNQKVISYTHKVKLHIVKYSFETFIDFSESQKIPLLGRDGFFNHFNRVNFDQNKKSILFKY